MRARLFKLGVSSVIGLTVLVTVPPLTGAAEEPGSEAAFAAPKLTVVRVQVSSQEEVDLLASRLDVWDVDLDRGVLEAAVGIEGTQMLRDLDFNYEIDHERTAKYNRPFEPLDGQTDGIPGYPCYRTVEETLSTGAALAAAYPDLAEWIDIGDSWEKVTGGGSPGYDLMVLRLTNRTNGIPSADKPKLWVMGTTHARELVSAETVTRFAEYVVARYDTDPDVTWVLDHHEIHLLFITNPDGRKHAETGLLWRKNTNENHCGPTSDLRGADLNRNYDFGWGCCGGSSSDPCFETYRGPSPESEPEIQAVRDWITANFTDWRPDDLTTPSPDHATGIFIDVHSSGNDVFYAFGFQPPPRPNDLQMLALGRKFSFFNAYFARQGGYYVVDGSTQDFGYGKIGLAAFIFELGTTFFQDCPHFENTIYPDNMEALLYAARAVRAPYTQSTGPEVVAPVATPNAVLLGDVVTIAAILDDALYGQGELSPHVSVENIAAAEVYVDVPPWQAGAAPVAMTAVDGAFDSSSEAVTATFSTTGLSAGRHIVYLRGQDAVGAWGTTRAVFIWVLDPSSAAHIVGQLTGSQYGTPLGGTVSAGPFVTLSSPASGGYELVLPEGMYDLTASALGHVSQTQTGVHATAGGSTTASFVLQRYVTVFADDVEQGNLGWIAEGSWAITNEASASPTHSWTDSPGGTYSSASSSTSLQSPPLDLLEIGGVTLEFSQTHEMDPGWDYGHVEVSIDGDNWTTVASYDGNHYPRFERAVIELPELDHAVIGRVRFRLETSHPDVRDGWHIDDILIRGLPELPPWVIFRDDFEDGDLGAWSVSVP